MLLITYVLIFVIINKLEGDAESVSHSYSIIHNLESVKAHITEAENGVRGYLITQNPVNLKTYHSGSGQVPQLMRRLKQLTANKDDYDVRVDSLEILSRVKLQQLSGYLTHFKGGGNIATGDMAVSMDSSSQVTDRIKSLIGSIEDREQALMKVRNEKLRQFFQTIAIMAIISLVITLVTIFYSLITYNKENKAKKEADNKAKVYSMELEGRVNELKMLNAELSELRSIEKFAATGRIARTMAHEVRNPLTNISLASEQLKESNSENEEAEMLLGMIDRSVNRINQLVSDLLQATRVEQLEYKPTNINWLLDEALSLANDRIELRHIAVDKEYDDAIPDINMDSEKIKLAFLNIIVNAIEAMSGGASGKLHLKTSRKEQKCIIEFTDNGSGIDEETLQKLFEPYFTSKAKGNGLGLTHTQNIIINHKGNIQVMSAPGEGTTFVVTLGLT